MPKLSDQYPTVMKCVRGEEWPAESFKTLVSFKDKVITHDSITVVCPAGHEFSLTRGVKQGWITAEDALKILAAANKELPDLKKQARKISAEWKKRPKAEG